MLQDARVKITESGYIPGQAFPTEQAHLEGNGAKIMLYCNFYSFREILFSFPY